jgi:hypothetical protein
MTRIDRKLLAFLCVGVWGLIAISLTSSCAQPESRPLDRRDVEEIVENCNVEIENGRSGYIYC